MTRFGKQPDRGLKDLASEAVGAAAVDAGILLDRVEAAYFGNALAGAITRQEMVAGQVALRPAGIYGIPVYNIENACASASTAFHLAWQSVAGGFVDIALAVGAERLTHPDKALTFEAIGRARDVESDNASGGAGRSPFMDIYAAEARDYMEATGATVRDFAAVTVKNQGNGLLNPLAQHGAKLTVDEVLESREIIWPLTLLMCSPISDGAAAAILVSESAIASHQRAIKVAASIVNSGSLPGERECCTTQAVQKAFAVSGIGPAELDLVELHDATASAELELYEDLLLCEPGDGLRLLHDGVTSLSGRLPVNPSGGLLARGHPIGATGLGQIYEVVTQLRHEAGARQVNNPRKALSHNAGGWLQGDNAAVAVHVFTR